MVTVKSVEKNSIAERAGLLPGDILISIDGNEITDVLDYRFYLTEREIELLVHRGPELFPVRIRKPEYDDIGLSFDTYLMDKKHTCKNKCIFCFIDQMPKGCRDTLYFKDDDSRLSFLQGNYITTTNLSDADIDRIIKMHLSPINVSVHTTEPDLRVFMMKNKNAGRIMAVLERLAQGGIDLNAQIVLCRGVNDGEHLSRSMEDLLTLSPHLNSVSVVPAGITAHREGLPELLPFSKEEARDVIAQIKAFSDQCQKKYGKRLFFASDEFYIRAELPFPPEEEYEGYPQFENGVGMITSLLSDFNGEIPYLDDYDLGKARALDIATGELAYPYILSIAKTLKEHAPNTKIKVHAIKNTFFGETITVAGLVVGGDLIRQLSGQMISDRLLIPAVMLRHEKDLFLDDTSVKEVSEKLGARVIPSEPDAISLIQSILYDE